MRTPASSPVKALTDITSPSPLTDDEEFRQKYLAYPAQRLMDEAVSRGYLVDWTGTDLENPRTFIWVADANGNPIPAPDFDEAFQLFQFDLPQCACSTQDNVSDAATRCRLYTFNIFACRAAHSTHLGQVILSCKKQRKGCNVFVNLDDFLINAPNISTRQYSRREVRAEDIRNFDRSGVLMQRKGTIALTPVLPSSQSNDTVGSPLSKRQDAMLAVKVPLALSVSGSSPKRRRNQSPLTSRPKVSRSHVADLEEFTVCEHSTDEDADVFRAPTVPRSRKFARHNIGTQTPTPSSSCHHGHSRVDGPVDISPPRYTTLDPQAYPDPDYDTRYNSTLSILDRYYWETAMLMDLPEPEDIMKRDRDLPPLRGSELTDSWQELDSIRGIPGYQFWRTIGKCECDRWFTKRALFDEHSQVCGYWVDRHPSAPPATQSTLHAAASPNSSLASPVRLDVQLAKVFSLPGKGKERAPNPAVIEEISVLRSPYPTVPHPSPCSPPSHPPNNPGDESPTKSVSDGASFNFSTSTSSDGMHTIQDNDLNHYLDCIAFETLHANAKGSGNGTTGN